MGKFLRRDRDPAEGVGYFTAVKDGLPPVPLVWGPFVDRQARLLKSGKLVFFFFFATLSPHQTHTIIHKVKSPTKGKFMSGTGDLMVGVKIHEVEAGEEKGNQSKNSRKKVKNRRKCKYTEKVKWLKYSKALVVVADVTNHSLLYKLKPNAQNANNWTFSCRKKPKSSE